MRPRVLFVTYGGGHAAMTAPVVKELGKHGGYDIDVLALTTGRKALEKQGVRCFSFRDLPVNLKARRYGKQLVESEPQHPDIPYEESLAYLGLSFLDLVDELGEEKAAKKYQAEGRHAFLPVNLMKKVIVKGQYDLVVATNSPRTERAAIEAAGDLGIPSLCMVDLFALHGVRWIGKRGYANKVCVLAGSVKRVLCKAGRRNDEIEVTGNPAFDYLAAPDIFGKAEKLRQNKGWGQKKIVLWCSQVEPRLHPFSGEKGDPDLPFRIEQELKVICDNCGWDLIVRPHPSENAETRKYLDGVEYGRNDELGPLLKAVDVVVVTSSTIGLEAMLLGKPVVALNMSIFSADMPFTSMGMAVGVDSLSELGIALDKVLRKKFSIDIDLPEIGSATKNVVKEIHALIQGGGGLDV